eukprot:21045_1
MTAHDFVFVFLSALGYSLGFLYRGSLAAIVDRLQDEFETTASGIGSLHSAFYITYTLMQLPSGLILEIYNPSIVLFISLFGLSACIIIFGALHTLTSALVIQFLSGLFVGPIFLAGASISQQKFGIHVMPLHLGIILGSAYIVTLSATTLQAWILDTFGIWREYFVVTGLVCAATTACLFWLILYDIRQSKHNTQMCDLKHNEQTNLLVECKVNSWWEMLIYGKDSNNITGKWHKLWDALKKSTQNYLNWLVGFHLFCVIGLVSGLNGLWLVAYMMTKFDYSRSLSTFISGLFYICCAIGGIVFGKVCAAFPKKKSCIVIICSLLNGFSLILIYLTTATTPIWIVIVLNCVSGFGAVLSITVSMVRDYNKQDECSDAATGFSLTLGNSTGFVIPFLIGELMDYNWKRRGANDFVNGSQERQYSVADYDLAFLVLVACFATQMILSFVLK